MKKSLFDNNDKYNRDAFLIETLIETSIRSAFKRFLDDGYSVREIAHVMHLTITDVELESILLKETK